MCWQFRRLGYSRNWRKGSDLIFIFGLFSSLDYIATYGF